MTRSFEAKAKIVASAFSSRLNEETDSNSSEILVKIFNAHDLSGPVALAYLQGHIELKSDDSRDWIENTFELLCTQFDFPPEDEGLDRSIIDQNSELDKSPNEMGNQFHAYFLEQQADFTTNLQEKDIPRKLLVENAPHSFPVIEVLEMQDLFSGAPEQNVLLSEVVKHWINEKQWNYLTALGYLLLLRDDSDFAINLLEESANLGDPWALFHLEGNSKSLTNSRREAYLLRAFEQGHGMAAFRLACLSIEKNDTAAANEWLIKGCLQGSSESTKALSNMVSSEDEKLMLSAIAAEQAGTDFETNREESNDEKSDTDAFDKKVRYVASAFYNRSDENSETEILTRIFESHDLSGAIALALAGGDIELKSDTPKIWIEDTFAILDSTFDFPDDETHSEPVLLTEAEVFVDYQDKKLNIADITLRDQITTRHHIEVNSGFAWIGIDDTDCEDLKLDLFFDTHAQISTIHTSPNEQEIVGIVALPYGPWTMPGEWGSTYEKYVNNLNEGDIIPASFLLEGCEKVHFSSDFIENEKPRIYPIKGNLGISSYWESS